MYALHSSIVSPRSRFTPLELMGEGRFEMGDPETLKLFTPLRFGLKVHRVRYTMQGVNGTIKIIG